MRIAIVNDAPLALEAVRRVLCNSGRHTVAWTAENGAQAVELCARDKPDLLLMDLCMPKVDGVEATRRIMARTPCPILIVTADVKANASKVFAAMGAGALDAVNTPALEWPNPGKGSLALLAKIDTLACRLEDGDVALRKNLPADQVETPGDTKLLVGIGASAGGPSSLVKVLSRLPASYPAAVVVVQHVDAQFVPALAQWLGQHIQLEVKLAQKHEQPRPGTVLLAGSEQHLVFTSATRLGYVDHPLDVPYRPSIDVFFKSASRHWGGGIIGLLLTGMGRDGAEGLKLLRDCGHHTIAQNEATCAVYGMPKAAAEMKAATEILSLDKIGPRLASLASPSISNHARIARKL